MAYEFIDEAPKGRYEFIDEPKGPPVSRTEKVLRGMKDPLDAAAQLFERAMPEGFNNANRSVNNWLAEKTGIFARMPTPQEAAATGGKSGVEGLIANQEAEYQNQRKSAGESGFDGYRTIGNIASPVNLAVAAKLPAAASLAGRVGVGALGGGLSGALSPVQGNGDFWDEKAKQVALGAAFGGAVPAVAGGVARVVSPNASKNASLDLLTKEGIKPTIGQTLGGWANRMEEKAQSIPIMGDAIAAARSRTGEELNRAAFNRALEPVKQKLPMDVKLGGDAVEYTRKTLGKSYDDLLPKLTTQADDPFVSGVTNLKAMVADSALDPKYAAKFEQILNDRVLNKFQGQSSMTGETLKATQEHLSKEIKRFGQSQDPDARLLGDALKEVGSQLNALVTRSNPKYAAELKAINTGYANFKRVQKAAGYLGADEGVFTPAQLQSAVKAADFSKDKARFAEGNAFMQDLSGAGKSMLSNKVPDSGTAGRLWLGGGALASGALNPAIPMGLIGGAALYTPQAQNLMRGLVSSRPQSAQAVADALRKTSPLLVPAGAQMGLGLLN
jgi:hypothetical protein